MFPETELQPSQEENQLIPERVTRKLLLESNQELHEIWSADRVGQYNLEKYATEIKKASGHFAVHAIPRLDLAIKCLKRGYVQATGLEIEKPSGYRAAESLAVHVAVDQVYWRAISRLGVLYAVEALLENKAIMDSPLKENGEPNEDWPISGTSDNPTDLSHQLSNNLGIVFIPVEYGENWAQQEVAGDNSDTAQLKQLCDEAGITDEFFPRFDNIYLPVTNLPTREIFQKFFEFIGQSPKRIYFYWGQKLEDGITDFVQKFNIQPKDNIAVSDTFERVIKNNQDQTIGSKGQADFYAIKTN